MKAPSVSSPTCVLTPRASQPDAIKDVREFIAKLGPQYLPAKPNEYAGKKQVQAQDAHEAIRPTNVRFTPESIRRYLSDEQYRLYKHDLAALRRQPDDAAVFDQTTVEIVAKAGLPYDFRVSGSVLKFDGHLKFEEEDKLARAKAKKQAQAEEEAAQAAEAARDAENNDASAENEDDDERRLPELRDGQVPRPRPA